MQRRDPADDYLSPAYWDARERRYLDDQRKFAARLRAIADRLDQHANAGRMVVTPWQVRLQRVLDKMWVERAVEALDARIEGGQKGGRNSGKTRKTNKKRDCARVREIARDILNHKSHLLPKRGKKAGKLLRLVQAEWKGQEAAQQEAAPNSPTLKKKYSLGAIRSHLMGTGLLPP